MLAFILLIIGTSIGLGVKVKIILPKFVRAGTSPTLVCQYDLLGKPLYSVKWYRGQHEFFRYVPLHKPAMIAFPIPGIEVDMMGSGAHQVTLINVPTNISGRISCEVSADGTFSTSCDSSNLNVVEMGIRKPYILTSDNYKKQQALLVNCSAQITDPPPKITFYIDNEKVSPQMIINLSPGIASLPISAINKFYQLSDNKTPLWVRCEAAVRGIYHLASPSVPIIPEVAPTSTYIKHHASLPLICVSFLSLTIISIILNNLAFF